MRVAFGPARGRRRRRRLRAGGRNGRRGGRRGGRLRRGGGLRRRDEARRPLEDEVQGLVLREDLVRDQAGEAHLDPRQVAPVGACQAGHAQRLDLPRPHVDPCGDLRGIDLGNVDHQRERVGAVVGVGERTGALHDEPSGPVGALLADIGNRRRASHPAPAPTWPARGRPRTGPPQRASLSLPRLLRRIQALPDLARLDRREGISHLLPEGYGGRVHGGDDTVVEPLPRGHEIRLAVGAQEHGDEARTGWPHPSRRLSS